ncbi:hypothetical protein QRX50_19485 [Amycolatopsis carbonis]|uniref:Uncharacterized protein n=1 Tax=Amycolatopsis carbonis TaxID=715471 RepID=A0A9Y2IP30_9PSEU|nr:hypothetical protein [Amycolatopsis sp. 2-15]WIX82801.1 hypothetical protein QRX50_19485 [Amycolatopsis sp. 2-15]
MTRPRPISPGLAVGASDGSARYATPDEADCPDAERMAARAAPPARQHRHFFARIGLALVVFAGACAGRALRGDTWWLILAGLFAVTSTGLARIGHVMRHRCSVGAHSGTRAAGGDSA